MVDPEIILLEHGILSPDLAEAMQGMIGFRNVLVHEYEDVDHQLRARESVAASGRFRGSARGLCATALSSRLSTFSRVPYL